MTIDDKAVAEVLDLVEREVMARLARDAASSGASEVAVALFVELCAEQLRARRAQHLAGTALWIERQLSVLH